MCEFNVCEIFSLLTLVILATVWALIWTDEIHTEFVNNVQKNNRYVILGLFEGAVLIIFVCIIIKSQRRIKEEFLRERASRILHTQSNYGSIERGENQLYFIQEKLAEMDKDELKRFRESLISRQSPAIYPELSPEENKRASISSTGRIQSKVKVRVLNTSCSSRSPMLLKMLLVGDPTTGKTSLLGRWIHRQFKNNDYKPTIGADFVAANLELDKDDVKLTSLSLQAWDIAGQERFSSMTSIYFHRAVCFCVVYDISNRSTLQGALLWIKHIQSKFENPYIVVLANKLDLKDHQIILPDDLAILESTDGLECYEVSAKTGENVEEVFRKVVLNTVLNQIQQQIDCS